MTVVSPASLSLFVLTAAAVAAFAVAGVWFAWGRNMTAAFGAAAAITAWLGISYWIGATGVLQDFSEVPPPFMLLVAVCTLITTVIAFSPLGTRLIRTIPPAWLVGYQAFRIPVEGFLDRSYHEGVVPVQMTFEGYNFDIVSGVTALGVAFYCARVQSLPRALILGWSVLGLALLINIVSIALLSTPSPLRSFHNEPPLTLVASAPFIWLPTFLVQAAWFGHILAFRLCLQSRTGNAA